jgi:hypothetical protein
MRILSSQPMNSASILARITNESRFRKPRFRVRNSSLQFSAGKFRIRLPMSCAGGFLFLQIPELSPKLAVCKQSPVYGHVPAAVYIQTGSSGLSGISWLRIEAFLFLTSVVSGTFAFSRARCSDFSFAFDRLVQRVNLSQACLVSCLVASAASTAGAARDVAPHSHTHTHTHVGRR